MATAFFPFIISDLLCPAIVLLQDFHQRYTVDAIS
jgi:hypothetical protein